MTTPLVSSAELERFGPLAALLGERSSVYHVGFVVPDIDAAIVELGGLLDIPFTEPTRLPVAALWNAEGRSTAVIRYAYSTRPVNVELIETVPGTLWDSDDPHRGHHLGVWSRDVEAEAARYESLGMPALWWGTDAEGRWMFSYHLTSFGFYIELVDSIAKAFYAPWFASVDPALAPWSGGAA